MAFRRSRNNKSPGKSSRRAPVRRSTLRREPRGMRLETLEERRLLAVGPELVAVQASSGSLLRQDSVEHVAPRDLVFRFDDGQVIDATSLAAITVTRLVPAATPTAPPIRVPIQPGFVGIGDMPNEVVMRFADTLTDDVYEVDIGGRGNIQLVNINNDPFDPDAGRVEVPFTFKLNLGAQIIAVVPQPINRGVNGQLTQARNQIEVYFNDDDLHPTAISSATPGVKPTVVDPQFYRLIFTNDTVTNQDGGPTGTGVGTVFNPSRIDYDPATDKAVLTFLDDNGDPLSLDQLPTGPGTYRLRIGTNEVLPAAPVTVNASIGVRSDFNTNHQVEILLTPDMSVAEGNEVSVEVERAAIPQGADPNAAASYVPDISVTGRQITVTLRSADLDNPSARGTTAGQLVDALNANPQANILLTATIAGGGQDVNLGNRVVDYSPLLLVDPGSRFTTATDLSDLDFSFTPGPDDAARTIVVSSAIDKQFFALNFPGAQDEPGHRDIPVQGHVSTPLFFSPMNTSSLQAGTDVADRFDGITTIPYNFRDEYGRNPGSGLPFINVISEEQKQRAREIFEIYSSYLGVQFVETEDQGLIIATGDLRAVNPFLPSQPGGTTGITGRNTLDGQLTVVLDNAENWSDEFGVDVQGGQISWFEEAMEGIGRALGLGSSDDLPPLTVQGEEGALGQSSTGEPFLREDNLLPGDHDVVHGQHLYRPDSKDVDLYRFQVTEFGRFTAEAFAERLAVASHLDATLSLYREEGDGTRTLISRNDDYYGNDPFVEMDLIPGVYYVGVTASGNTNFDPENGDTGIGGKTDGKYDLRLNFRPQADAAIVDIDTAGNLPDRQALDGDGDGVPGGVFNFWFRALPPLNPAAPQIDSVVYVDKAAPASGANGTLAQPFREIDQAFSFINSARAANPGASPEFVVRILGNDGPTHSPLTPLDERLPYVLGRDPILGQPLADGVDMEIPQGVTVMIDEGAVFKMRRSSVIVGSLLPTIDRSKAAVQVLGVPGNNVIFTSYNDEAIGQDTNASATQTPSPGDWGGIIIRNDVDRSAPGQRFDYERQGIFLNHINQTDFRYGGGSVTLGSVEEVVAPISMVDARPTITFNTITRSADAAMSANPDSFEESNFHDPITQQRAYDPVTGDAPFTVDYRRVGPDIHGNRLVLREAHPSIPNQFIVHRNSLNGLFVRIGTASGQATETMTVAGRFDDKDIVHILQENLEVEGKPGGLVVESYIEAPAPIPLARTAGGTLAAGTYNYFVTFIDAAGIEGPRSAISNNSVITGGPGQGTIRLRIQEPTVGEFVQYRLYRSGPTGTGPYTLVTQQQVGDEIYNDTGATLGGVYTGAARGPQFQQTLPGGALGDGTYNYFVTFVDINGVEGPASPLSQNVNITPGTPNRTVRLGIEQPPLGEHLVWRLYRSQPNGRSPYVRVVERPATEFTYDDDGDFNDPGEIAGLTYRGNFVRVERGRPDARLKVDPNVIVKTEGARIEATLGAQIIAEGRDGQEVIFTSLVDQRYGAGGTFNTANRSTAPQPGDWGGIYVGHTGTASFDHAVLAFGGGVTRVPGGFANFNVLEIHQAQARVANSTFEFNTDGVRELDQVDDPDRVGRGVNAPGVIFIRGAQPVIINNLIRNYPSTVAEFNPAITINVNALNSDLVTDWGRSTGELDRFTQMLDNQGPLFRNNILVNDEVNNGALHGMMVRGNVLTTEGVWDDTDIVHILMNEVLVPDFHSKGGLRLESSPTESLVIKLRGADAGFTASGRPLEIDDRIGGSLHIVGQPGHPVILTSLADDSAAAGLTLNGGVQFDTDNDGDDIGTPTTPGPVPPPSTGPLVVTSTTNNANALRDALLGPGVIPVGNAMFTGSATSAGLFQSGGSSIGIETGILLTSGDANFAAGPNQGDGSSGQASGQGDPQLDQLFNVTTRDTTALEFDFMIAPGGSNNLFFNYVFASEEYNEFANSAFNDVFAFFLDGQNIALIPGTQTFVSINNVNGGDPLGTNPQNPQFYNNNDPSDNGGFLAEFGYDGFTTVFQAQALNLSPGQHTIRLVVSDVTDTILDTGVFLQAGSFSNVPVPPTIIPESGDWRSIKLLEHANDRNVALTTEREANNAVAPGLNAVPENAQFIGELAPSELAGDDVRRLGIEVHGFLTARNDIDVYSFRAQTGTEVWFDIDNTTHGLDTVLELIDANGVVIARSDNSLNETSDPSLLFRNTSRIAANHVNPLAKSDFEIDDHFSTNPKDAGMRVVLPGSTGAVGTYHVRVRSAGSNTPGELLGGRSSGRYELQLRLREKDEIPGTTVNFADIRFATTGIEVQGLPLHSPLLGEFAETSSSNQVRADAQNLGNVLQSDRGAITVAGFLDGPNPDDPVVPNNNQPNPFDPDDVDWYRFNIDYDSIGGVTNRGAGLIFDLDFADNLGRPNARIAIFDTLGRLILSSDNSNISDDVSAPQGGTGARDLERGSGGPLDPFLGPIQLPAGEYFIAVSHAGDRPAELDVTSHAPNNPLVRLEPIESVARIAEDHIGSQGGSTVQPQQPLTPLFGGGAGTFVPFNLSDVNLFVSTSFGEQTDLHIVDAFNGAQEAFVGRFGEGTGDIAMRGDGSLFSYSVDRVGGDAQNDAQQGNFLQIDTGNGQATNLRDDGIMTFEPDAQGNPQRTHPFPPPNGGRIGHGISFNAMSFNRTGSQLFVAGNRGNFYQPGAEYVSNILYRMEGSDVDNDGLAAGLPDTPQRQVPLGRAGTNFLDQGEIPTAIDLVGGGASVIVAPGATTVTSGGTQFVINDGDQFDIQVDDGFGNLSPPVTFEFNSGPEATINFNIAANEFFVDGEFFTLDGQRFEFDTGVVLVPNGFQPGQLTEGAQIEIRDNAATPNVRVFEITTDQVVQQGAIPLMVTPQMTEAQFVSQVFVPAVNQQFTSTTFNAQAFLSNGRVTLTGDSFVVLRGGNTGFNLSGNYGVSGNSIRIFAEETFQPGEIIQQILNVMNGVPGSPTNPLPGVPGIEAGAEGTRINFLGAQMGDFDSNDTVTAASPGTARFMTGVPGSDGSVAMGNWEIPFFASDSGEDIALKIIAAVEDVSMDNTANDPMDRFDPNLVGVIPNGTNPPSRTVQFSVDPTVYPNPGAQVLVNIPQPSPFTRGGTAPGGEITGMAFVGNELYAVSDAGGLYHIRNPNQVAFRDPITTNTFVDTDYIESALDLVGISFSGLTAGPPNLQGGAYADLLFGIDASGNMHAFDTNGVLQPIFQDGATSVSTGVTGPNMGLAFSTLDYNPWHTTSFETGDPFRWNDPGHGIEPTATNSRTPPRSPGNSSLYFGNSLRDLSNQFQGLQAINREGRTVTSLGQEAGDRLTYDFPGGAHGTVQSAPFSLKGYGAADQPTLYFNYFLDTEDANSAGQSARDTFRVFVTSDDPSLPADPVFSNGLIQGQWYTVGTNNVVNDINGNPTIPADGASPFNVQALHDVGNTWRQARIDLSPFAGLENIRLRFDFSTAGSMDTPEFGFGTDTGGEELKVLPASELRDGQTFRIDGQDFEFDLGVTMVAPTGDAIADGETFTINDGLILPVSFEFDNDNTFERNIRAANGSFFRDGDTFTITDGSGVTQAFEFESGYTLVVPPQGGIMDGDTFTIDDGLGNANSVTTYEFDTQDPTLPDGQALNDPSHVRVNIIGNQSIVIPSAGGGFGGVRNGDTFTITDQNNTTFIFEYDTGDGVGQTGGNVHIAIPITAVSSQDEVALATEAAIDAQMMNPAVDATYVGDGFLQIGTTEVRLDVSGSQALGKQLIVGTPQQIADFIVEAVQAANPGLTPLHTMRGGQFTGEVHLGDPPGPPTHTLDTSGTPALRQRGEPGLMDPNAIAVPFTPDQNFTSQQVAGAIAQAVNQANSQGFGVSASVANNVVVLSGSNFQFSPGSTALTTDLVIPIPFTASQSAEQVAAAIAAAIANTQLNVATHLVGNRINLENLSPANPLSVGQTPGAGSAVPGVRLEGQAGALTGVPIPIHSEMSAEQVRDAVAEALNRTFAPEADAMGINTFTVHDNVVRIQGHTITNAGPLGATSLATAPGNSSLPGDSVGAFNNSNPALRGQNNRFEGVYVDDIIIGFAERGEMATGPNRGDDSFVHTGLTGTVGAYQLEIRRASEYGAGQLNILRSFDTNDRLSQDVTLFASPGSQINPTSTFTISDGVDAVVFEYVNADVPGAEPQPGNVPIFFSPSDSAAEVANIIRDVINSQQVQQNRRLNVQAASNDSSDRVDLVGETVKVNLIKPGLTVDGVTTDANDLRDAILGSGAIPVGDAQFLGGAFSAGFFSGGTSSIGIESGIVLSTGDARFAEGPNLDDGSSEQASAVEDADLDAEFGVVTEDTTVLEFSFQLDDAASRDLFFNFVFASEEYNEFVNSQFNDVFAFFVDGQNIAFVPGTTDPVSINTVNGGNPFGTAANNPQAYNNNDPDENGQFLNRFGLDGFTNVFTAVARDLAPGVHTIKLAISDVGDEILDSAVFIEAGSFGSAAPQDRVRNGIVGIRHNEIGDENRVRDQGQLIISNNFISNSSTFGMVVESGDSVPRSLEQLNQDRLAPGVVIRNNVFARNAEGGLRFAGNASPDAAVPFGRIINNTFFGIPNVASTTLTTIVNDNNDFFSVDPQTLAVTHLGSVNRVFTDIAVSSTGQVFAIDGQAVSTSSLFNVAVDVANPGGPLAVTTLGSIQRAGGGNVVLNALEFHPDGRLLGAGGSTVYMIDPATRVATPFAQLGTDVSAGDIAIGPNGNFYVSTVSGALYFIDGMTGQAQTIGTLPNNDFFGLTFSPQAQLLGFRTGGEVYQINAATAAATLLGTLTNPLLSGVQGGTILAVNQLVGSGVGVLIENNAGPTLMNNIISTFETGISVDASSEPNTVIASTLYHNNTTNSTIGLGTNFPVVYPADQRLFVDPANNNFYLLPGTPAIDSSIDSLQDRPSLRNVKASVNIPASNVLAPERDALGQLRRDDPSFQPPFGTGQVVFKDRGAIDRVDFAGPTADLIVPRDNDAAGLDQDPASFSVRTSGQLVSSFQIRLVDGVEPIDPSEGTGIDASTVTAAAVKVEYFAPTDVGLTTPTLLQVSTDYTFNFNPVTDTITIKDVGGLFLPGFYRIRLDNTPIDPNNSNDDGVPAIRDVAGNPLKPNRQTGETIFLIQIPDNLDFGDAPASYGTLVEDDGPRHTIVPNFFLGTQVDAELNGVPSVNADGDGSDEDGVRVGGQLLAGAGLNVGATVALEVFASAAGFLDAWIDFNRNGVFEPEERIADSVPLNSAGNILNVQTPDVAPEDEATLLGPTYARFRFSSEGGLNPTGPAQDGEVEDYRIVLKRSDSPWQNPTNNLDVNADGLVTILDALLVVTDIRNNNAVPGTPTLNVHQLYLTQEEAEANNQLFVPPNLRPFVDVNGDSLVTVADLQQIVAALRARTSSGGNGEPEGEAAVFNTPALDVLAPEGEAESDAGDPAPAVDAPASAGWDLSTPRTGPAAPAEEQEQSSRGEGELVLANSSFRTFEFESALSEIAGDVSGVWGEKDEDELRDLEDYFPFEDVLETGSK